MSYESSKSAKEIPKWGVAAFVKTPGKSPVKTRLAAGIGEAAARAFYELSCQATESMLKRASSQGDIAAYWAVAEPDGAECWPGLPTLQQGEGGLGSRLHRVYSALRKTHRVGILIGTDCPHFSERALMEAARMAEETRGFVMGPSADGGFYLLAGALDVSRETWESVEYSRATTGHSLLSRLKDLGPCHETSSLTDVDVAEDFSQVAREIEVGIQGDSGLENELASILDFITKLSGSGPK